MWMNEWMNGWSGGEGALPTGLQFQDSIFPLSTCVALVLTWPNSRKGMTVENISGTKGT